jgi:HK97 family phage prohead protease/HK97 family phage major capsid protein
MPEIDQPDDDENYMDFMDRCTDDNDEDACQTAWDDAQDEKSGARIVHKTHVSKADGLDFTMSDETVDRMGEVISLAGWDLGNFDKHAPALFNHKSDFVIGEWHNVRVEGGALRGRLVLAKQGTSDRINEIRSLVEQGILKAVSVGFSPIDKRPIDDKADKYFGPFKYLKQELVECSLVSIPANPNALALAKGLKISADTLRMVFAKHGKQNTAPARRHIGKQAETSPPGKTKPMSTLAQNIIEAEKRLLAKKDELAAFHDAKGDGNYTDADMETIGKANAEVAHEQKVLATLRDSEKNLGEQSDGGARAVVPAAKAAGHMTAQARPFSLGPKKVDPIELFLRAGTAMILAQRERKPVDEIRRQIFGDDEATRAVTEWQTKAASTMATTTTVGWAAELVQQIVVDFMATLYPKAIYPRFSAMGLSLTFGRNGKVIIPTRSRTPTIAGSFVGEGLPIPVRQGAFTSQSLTPKKMAVITTWTREIDEHSIPAIEGLLRDAIQTDTAISLDSVLIDANPATAIRPAGILNGVAGLTPTAGGGFNALTGDIKQLSGALLTGTLGNVRNPRWLMNPQQVNSAGLAIATGAGVFPFRDEISQGRLGGWPIIQSGTVPAGTVIAIDAADFVSVTGDGPRFEISDQATLHMEDTTPTDISTAGTPAVVAYPAKSMFQTDSMALRLIMPINWTIRRAGTVAWVAGVTW